MIFFALVVDESFIGDSRIDSHYCEDGPIETLSLFLHDQDHLVFQITLTKEDGRPHRTRRHPSTNPEPREGFGGIVADMRKRIMDM